eukprot:CAMPEP_0177770696 /NCGR_PEP_ID=MMETSP0491_2-20121128/11093_1 /TAXON_ID=63592 /ORGANISM="Tetraselmis chuii, Strain PLY429" /LENGTH=712 /DNA_ID=CAMNT_0019287989 /DNA_START=737 /DNA_END=2875 /DNA_ORIENTATION=+
MNRPVSVTRGRYLAPSPALGGSPPALPPPTGPIRVRLRWASSLGLPDCWEEVPSHMSTVGELCAQLWESFRVEAGLPGDSRCKLSMDGFELRHGSAISVLRDGDLLDVDIYKRGSSDLPTLSSKKGGLAPSRKTDSAGKGGREKQHHNGGEGEERQTGKRKPVRTMLESKGLPQAKKARKDKATVEVAQPAKTKPQAKAKGVPRKQGEVKDALPAPAAAAEAEPVQGKATPSRSARRKAAKRRLKRMGVLPRNGKGVKSKAKAVGKGANKTDVAEVEGRLVPVAAAVETPNEYLLTASSLDPNGSCRDGGEVTVSVEPRTNLAEAMARAGDAAPAAATPEGAVAKNCEESSSSEEESSSAESSGAESSSSESSPSEESSDEEESSSSSSSEEEGEGVPQQQQLPHANGVAPTIELKGYMDRINVCPKLLGNLRSLGVEDLQPGMVVAYKLLELSASGCPEVSDWRLGVVGPGTPPVLGLWPARDDPALPTISRIESVQLAANVRHGPFCGDDGCEDEEEEEGMESVYDDDGRLNIADVSFVDLRALGKDGSAAWATLRSDSGGDNPGPYRQNGALVSHENRSGGAVCTTSKTKLQPPRARPSSSGVIAPPANTGTPVAAAAQERAAPPPAVSGGWAALAAELAERKRALAAAFPPVAGHDSRGAAADGVDGSSPGTAANVRTPGAVRPRGGARRTAIGPLLAMLRSESEAAV